MNSRNIIDTRPMTESVTDSASKIWLAGLGTMSIFQKESGRVLDKGSSLYKELVSRGKSLEDSYASVARRVFGKVENQAEEVAAKVVDGVAEVVDQTAVYHLLPNEGNWVVRKEGSKHEISVHGTKQKAVTAARGIARAHEPSRLVVHRADGTIQDMFSYEDSE